MKYSPVGATRGSVANFISLNFEMVEDESDLFVRFRLEDVCAVHF